MTFCLHIVTDDEVVERKNFLQHATGILETGVAKVFHLRGPGTSSRTLLRMAEALSPIARSHGTNFVINDRVDLALIHDVDGVHLGGRSLPPKSVREILGSAKILGKSVHNVQEGIDSAEEGIDYLFLGSIFGTASHPGSTPLGLEPLRSLSTKVEIPVIAIGGVTSSKVSTLLKAGAQGVAVLGDIWGAPSPLEALLCYQHGE